MIMVANFSGRYVKDADKDIIEAVKFSSGDLVLNLWLWMTNLKQKGRLVKLGTFTHSYPCCWISDTPLIYRVVPSWFVRVEQLKEQSLENDKLTYWVPDYVKFTGP
ncbi:Aminoacyl-tRNA synthetase, class Ia [Corchorus olitorius]|uniref:Aminoacyl-tRNA synthetase, class Ia n=1 Tax=Corchorus olitorius TaxID=93759 RepID=A0A1R3K6K5_9ROSI|nr:Aminoacyl-tRNA synthetase, class Ia [Corchorus olitorius]